MDDRGTGWTHAFYQRRFIMCFDRTGRQVKRLCLFFITFDAECSCAIIYNSNCRSHQALLGKKVVRKTIRSIRSAAGLNDECIYTVLCRLDQTTR